MRVFARNLMLIYDLLTEIRGRLDKETPDKETPAKDLMLSYLQSNLMAVGNILSKTTDMLLKAHADKNRVDVETMICMNMDAITIMGHTTYNSGQRGLCYFIGLTCPSDYLSLWRRVADTT